MDKGAWRGRLLRWRDELGPADRRRRNEHIAAWVQRWLAQRKPGVLMAYYPIRSEVDLTAAVQWARGRGWTVALPRVEGPGQMSAVVVSRWDALRPGAFGIPEPQGASLNPRELDVILVPGAAFDRRGHRLGYGRGFYDRFLPDAVHARVAGAAYREQWVETLPTDPHDVPVQYVVVEQGVWCVREGRFLDLGRIRDGDGRR